MTSPNPAPFKYNATAKGLMMWASSELEHVGRIAAVEDSNIQYAYALSTLNGMAHLKDAIFEYVSEHPDAPMTADLLVIHEQVVRVMKHLLTTYKLDVNTIEAFNTRGTLSTLNYLKKGGRKTRKRVSVRGGTRNNSMGYLEREIAAAEEQIKKLNRSIAALEQSIVTLKANLEKYNETIAFYTNSIKRHEEIIASYDTQIHDFGQWNPQTGAYKDQRTQGEYDQMMEKIFGILWLYDFNELKHRVDLKTHLTKAENGLSQCRKQYQESQHGYMPSYAKYGTIMTYNYCAIAAIRNLVSDIKNTFIQPAEAEIARREAEIQHQEAKKAKTMLEIPEIQTKLAALKREYQAQQNNMNSRRNRLYNHFKSHKNLSKMTNNAWNLPESMANTNTETNNNNNANIQPRSSAFLPKPYPQQIATQK